MSKRINVILPDNAIALLDRVTSKGSRSSFISRAVLHYIETQSTKSLREQLKDGYRANAQRDLEIAAEWFPLEQEAQNRFAASQRPEKAAPRKRK
jgi:CopG family transcriptional regulator/antitoxin EndoAI